MIDIKQQRNEGTTIRLGKVIKNFQEKVLLAILAFRLKKSQSEHPIEITKKITTMPISNLRSDARRQFKDEYSKKLDLKLDDSKGRLGMHGKGFYIVVNDDVD